MSAFVISTETMDRCVRGLCAFGKDAQVIWEFAGLNTARPTAWTEIGRKLYSLNVEAVMQRYPDTRDDPRELPGAAGCAYYPYIYTYRAKGVCPSRKELIESVRALHCLSYQCAEGNIPKTRLYLELRAAIGTICEYLVSEMPEYEAAEWD